MADKDPDFSSHKYPSASQVVEELKELWGMALPITAMNCLVYVRAVVSVLFLGHLGILELAGGGLFIGFTNITGYSVLVGLASGLEPVCSQAYGSKNWDLLSLSLQRMIFILYIAIIPISLLWINMETIMITMGQDKDITATAATYCIYSLPDFVNKHSVTTITSFSMVTSGHPAYDVLFVDCCDIPRAVECGDGDGVRIGCERCSDCFCVDEFEYGGVKETFAGGTHPSLVSIQKV